MLRGIASELNALPVHAAPPDLRARIRTQIERESVASSPVLTARRSLFPRVSTPIFKVPRWATISFSGALVTACLLLSLARQPRSLYTSSALNNDLATSSAQTSSEDSGNTPSASVSKAVQSENTIRSAAKVGAQSTNQKTTLKPTTSASATPGSSANPTTSSTRSVAPTMPGDHVDTHNEPSASVAAPASSPLLPSNSAPRQNISSAKTSPQSAPAANSTSSQDEKRFAQLEVLPSENPTVRGTIAENGAPMHSDNASSGRELSGRAVSGNGNLGVAQDAMRSRSALPASSAAANSSAAAQSSSNAASSSATTSGAASTTGNARNSVSDNVASGAMAPQYAAPKSSSRAVSGASTREQPNNEDNSGSSASSAPTASAPTASTSTADQDRRRPKSSSTRNANSSSADSSSASFSRGAASVPDTVQSGAGTQSDTIKNDANGKVAPRDAAQNRVAVAGSLFKGTAKNSASPLALPAAPLAAVRTMKKLSNEQAGASDDQASQRARLTIVPRLDASSARLVVQWQSVSPKNNETVVWRGAARRHQPIVVIVFIPHDASGNKNRRVQVSLQVLQANKSQNTWKTVDSTTLNASVAQR